MQFESLQDANAMVALVIQQRDQANTQYATAVLENQKILAFAQGAQARIEELENMVRELGGDPSPKDENATETQEPETPKKSNKRK
jgi:phage terminase small subunit